MEIRAPQWRCKLAPFVEVQFIARRVQAAVQEGLWAIPGGGCASTVQVRQLCRRQGWRLVEDPPALTLAEARRRTEGYNSMWSGYTAVTEREPVSWPG